MKSTMMAVLALAFLAGGCAAERTSPPKTSAAEEQSEASTVVLASIPSGVDFSGAILVARGDDIIVREAVSSSSGEGANPIDLDSRFAIASMTKSFTAALVLELVDQDLVALDDTLSDLLPALETDWADQVTLGQMLRNRSGIPHYVDIPGWFDNEVKRSFSDESFLDAISALELKFEPGSDYLYSNVNYFLLACIIDRYSGMPYEDYLRSQILGPLGMQATGQLYEDPGQLAPNSLRLDDGTYETVPIVNPVLFRGTASMYSTIDDLRRWGQAVMDGQVYSKAGQRNAFDEDLPMAWALGQLPLGGERTTDVIYYNGRLIGYLSLIMLLPDEDGLIIVLNNNSAGYDALLTIAGALAAQVFGEER